MNSSHRYECGNCEAQHPTELTAANCCPNEAVDVYVCGKCNKRYYDETEANECCTEETA
jgi:hypothetical protein